MADANVWEPGCTDAEGGSNPVGGDGYVPTAGTVADDPIVGPLVFSNAVDGTEYTLSMPSGALNSLVFAATINGNSTGYIIDTSDGANAYRFNFQEDGFLVLPSGKDYDSAPDDAVVSKTWIEDAIASGGNPNTYLKLTGTDPGVPFTGVINFEDSGSGINYDIGLIDFAGFTGMYFGKAIGGSAEGGCGRFSLLAADHLKAHTGIFPDTARAGSASGFGDCTVRRNGPRLVRRAPAAGGTVLGQRRQCIDGI